MWNHLVRWMGAFALLPALAGCPSHPDHPAQPRAPVITSQPGAIAVDDGAQASFSVVATGDTPLAYRWRRNGIDIVGANAATLSLTARYADSGAAYSVVVTNAAGTATSADALLTVTPLAPTISAQPADQSVPDGATAEFEVAAVGSGTLSYQWRRNGVNLVDGSGVTGANSPTLSISVRYADDQSSVSVVVSGPGGTLASNNALLTVQPVAPAIVLQPADTSVPAGQNAAFSVLIAGGTAPVTYQWLRNGANVAGATGASYQTPATTLAENGAVYAVAIVNPAGTTLSRSATLTVTATAVAPSIAVQPLDATIAAGQAASFAVVASGSAPLAYQWRKNGADIAEATASTYSTPPATAADDGARFSVVVSNAAGSITSAEARLAVAATWIGIHQDGTHGDDAALAITTDAAGNVAVAGRITDGVLPGEVGPTGGNDAFLAKYAADGRLLWARQLSSTPKPGQGVSTIAYGVAADAAGNLFIVGETTGTFAGETSAGGADAFVAKFDPAGTRVWLKQFGSTSDDKARGIGVDASGNVVVVGWVQAPLPGQPSIVGNWDAYIAKFDNNGVRLWINQFGSLGTDEASAVATDAAGNIYIAGTSNGDLFGTSARGWDAFVAKFDATGTFGWLSRLAPVPASGFSAEFGSAVAVTPDGTHIYCGGKTQGVFDVPKPSSDPDAFVARLQGDGQVLWVHQIAATLNGLPRYDETFGVATDATGAAVFVAGYTEGTLPGAVRAFEGRDLFVARYESDGALTWARQIGSGAGVNRSNFNDTAYAIALNGTGDIFAGGVTSGVLGPNAANLFGTDWFVVKMRPADGLPY